MPFVARDTFTFADSGLYISGRLYTHSAGLVEVFGGEEDNAADYFLETVCPAMKQKFVASVLPTDSHWYIAAVWGDVDRMEKRTDLFFFRGIERGVWPGNPTVVAAGFAENRLITPYDEIGCGDAMIMLGAEEWLRRVSSRNVADYLERECPLNQIPWQAS